MLGRATGNTNTLNSPRLGLGGSRHLPPYSILCASPQGPHPNGFLSWDSQVGVLKLPKLGVPQLWNPITLRTNLGSRCDLKQSCSSCQQLSNGIWHATCTQGNRGDSWLLVIRNQTSSLILGPSFGHNLCFRCPNEQCEPILDIYVPRAFQWYKEHLNPMRFDPCNRSLKIWKSIGIPIPKVGVHLGVWGFIPSHSLAFLGSRNVTPRLTFDLQPCKSLPWSRAQARVAT
jgi:hypothetical protein